MRRGSHTNSNLTLAKGVWSFAGSFVTFACTAANLQIVVTDPAGRPVADTVVVATARTATSPGTVRTTTESAILDQIDKAFIPEVLVIRTGTAVVFPNSDSIAHQVYSFSPAKRFALPLYRGQPYPPVVFDQPGIVALGCNIHDRMVGYIYVTDSPHFGKTDASGRVELQTLAAATYRISVWSPRLNETVKDRDVVVSDSQNPATTIALTRTPRAAAKPSTDPRIRDY